MSIEDIKNRLAAATPGPWELGEDPNGGGSVTASRTSGHAFVAIPIMDWTPRIADAEFIAHAPDDIARLVKALEAVQKLHASTDNPGIGPYCAECNSEIDGGPKLWPCATVRAITEALDS